MSSILLSLPQIYADYKSWVSRNPQKASECETAAKFVSYFIAGKINNSHALSELVYCLSNLLVLFNDRIIYNLRQLDLPGSGDNLKLWLTVLEYCEVFCELSAQKLWGHLGKWCVVVAIQFFKCISRLFLIYRHKENMIQNPPIPPLERAKINKPTQNGSAPDFIPDIAQSEFNTSLTFTLKGSGRVIRKVDASPPVSMRAWKPVQGHQVCDNEQTLEQALAGRQLFAETLYCVKPIAHLGALACFGGSSWKPWAISLAIDLTSLQLYGSCKRQKVSCLSVKQRQQLSKRTLVLLMYLLRSPFYEKHSHSKIQALLVSLSRNVPLARLICKPIAQYLPFWQSCYFYMWST